MSPTFACGRHAALEARVQSLELRPDPGLLLPELIRYRTSAEEAKAAALEAKAASASTREIATATFDEVSRLKVEVTRLAEWRDDSKVHEIKELRMALEQKVRADVLEGALTEQRESLHDIVLDERKAAHDQQGDRRKFRYALVLALVGAAASGVVGGRVSAHPQCSHAAVG